MVLNYYPGCTLKNQAAELDRCARASAEALGVTLEELPQWQCCGGVYPMASDEIATRLSAVRALAEAGERAGTLVTVCSAPARIRPWMIRKTLGFWRIFFGRWGRSQWFTPCATSAAAAM